MSNSCLKFYPLYVIYHDQWGFRTWNWTWAGWSPTNYPHRGHCHFFMPDLDMNSPNVQKAYDGNQIYNFSLKEIWGPNSSDDNQLQNLKVIGTPKWYFHIKEYWRRVYVQAWDNTVGNSIYSSFLGKKGIKYDASLDLHTFGPFRETKNNFFYFNNMARTLPVEYWHDSKKTTRDHYLNSGPDVAWNNQTSQFADKWGIPTTMWAGNDGHQFDGDGPSVQNCLRVYGYADKNYAYPTIEYQEVTQLNYERLPGFAERDVDADNFGDGFEVEVSLPYTVNTDVKSPFSFKGVVQPFGTYCHDFDKNFPDSVPKYPETDHIDIMVTEPPASADEWRIPTELKGQPIKWSVPDRFSANMDGIWVEQFLGGIIRAKACVTVEDNFGGRKDVWVTSNQFMINTPFEGTDQGAPAV